MIRVLNIISDTNTGGAGRAVINYLKYSDRSRFETLVAMPKGAALKGPVESLGVKVCEVDGMAPDKSMDLKTVGALKKLIRETRPGIVHTHGSLSGRIAGRQAGAVVIFTRHSAFPVPDRLKKGPGRYLNKLVNEHYADAIIAVSPAAAENLTDGGVSPERVEVVMNGVEPVARRPVEERTVFRREHGIAPGDFVAGILARVEDYKGHDDILDAMARLVPERPRLKLLVAGTGSREEEVRKRAGELGLTGNVVFLGFLTDVAPVLSVLDVQLNASWGTEATSLSLLEGFSMGVPAVASDYGGNPWTVTDGVDGLLFKTRDAADLAEKLKTLMDGPPLREKLGLGALREYEKRFTGEAYARRIEEIYLRTWEERNGKRK